MKHLPWALGAALGLVAASPAAAEPAQAAVPAPAMPRSNPAELPRVFAARVSVADLDRAERFYRDGLGAARVVRVQPRERMVQFSGGPGIVLVQGAPRAAGAPVPESSAGFILQVADIDAVAGRVAAAGGIVTRPPNSGTAANSFGVRAAMIRDPDGTGIEVIQFPAGH